jgi:hypothetical protein
VSADEDGSSNASGQHWDRLQLSDDDARLLEEEARRLNVSREDLLKRLVEEMVIARAAQTAGEASPDQLVLEAVQAFTAKRKGERPPDR